MSSPYVRFALPGAIVAVALYVVFESGAQADQLVAWIAACSIVTLVLYAIGTTAAAVVALIMSEAFPQTIALRETAQGTPPAAVSAVLGDVLFKLVDNPVNALLTGNFLGCLTWAVLLGVGFRKAPEGFRRNLQTLAEGVSEIVRYVIMFAPVGIFAMLISPTMKRNLNCFGCYSGSYSTQEELSFEVIDRLVGECKEMGVYLVIITGGEPFLRKDLFDLFEKHPDTLFQVYTNSTLIDEKMVERFVSLGNVVPSISLEGLREETDLRRGKGHFDKVVRVMDWPKKAGIFFAISTTQTKLNSETIGSDAFVDFLVEKGSIFLWELPLYPDRPRCRPQPDGQP